LSTFFDIEAQMDTVWTEEQLAIFEKVAGMEPGSSLAVKARAGTGKTTTAIESLFHIRRPGEDNRAAFLAFNKKNGAELNRKTPGNVRGATFHAMAMSILKKNPDVGKMWKLAKKKIEGRRYKLRAPAVQLASLGKNLGIGLPGGVPDRLDIWEQLVTEYGIRHQKRFSVEEVAFEARSLFEVSLRDFSTLDFDDFLYSVARDGVGAGFKPLDWLYVDEFQDSNPTQMLMMDQIRKASDGHTRFVLIGDPKQAIYGWRGAGVHSFDLGVRRYKADVLPLTTSWRCPQKVILSAQELVPDIRARPEAPEGEVLSVTANAFDVAEVQDGDVVLCRNNAPLFSLALEAVDRGRAVHVAGKGLDRKIQKVFERLFGSTKRRSRDPNDRSVFSDEIVRVGDEYKDRPFAKALILDEVLAARSVWDILRRTSDPWQDHEEFYQDAETQLRKLFFDPSGGKPARGVVLSTIHMSKGMEWDNVYFYQPELIPSKASQALGGWHLEQEANLDYVARTRAKNRLIFVSGKEER